MTFFYLLKKVNTNRFKSTNECFRFVSAISNIVSKLGVLDNIPHIKKSDRENDWHLLDALPFSNCNVRLPGEY